MARFPFGSRKSDPVEKRRQELEAQREELRRRQDELRQELAEAAQPREEDLPPELGPPVWRAGEEEWETLSDRTSYSPRRQRDQRARDRNQFVVLGLVLVVVLALIFYVLWPVAAPAG
ncbi:MAG: hypothetical protein AAGK14_08770 [Verrucomicrobiota bacterium]